MSAQSIATSHRIISETQNLIALNANNLQTICKNEDNINKCKDIMNNVNNSNMNNNSKTGTNCSLHLNNMFALPLNNVSPLYLFSEHNLVRTTANSNSNSIITTMTATSAHLHHKTHNNNNLNSIREGNTPSPLTLSAISTNLNDSSGNTFSMSKPSRTSDGLISGLNFNHNDVLREGGFMNYHQSSPAENATSTPTSFTTSSLDGYLTGGQGGHSSNHSFDLLDSDSFSEMPNSLSPSCQATYDDNSGHSYVETKKSCSDSNIAQNKKKRKSGPSVRPACPDCGKEFSNQSALSKHKLTHSDERKFVCTQCAKAFKRQDHLNGHLLTHRSKKPYECDVEGCEKTYCDARSLRRHKENHHPGGTNTTQSTTLPTVALIPGIALNFSSNVGIANQTINRIQYAPPPVTTSMVPVSPAELPSAATQLQLLALHKHDNNVNNCEKWSSRESSQKWNQHSSEMEKNSLHFNNELSKIKQESNNKSQSMTSSNSNVTQDSQENALLHQLLTQQHFKDKQPVYQVPQQMQHQMPQQQHLQNHQQQHQQQQQQPQQTSSSLPSVESQQDNWPYTMFSQNNNMKSEPQQVECSLCQRKFKNIPALNGHMRLHGGYLKNQTQNFNNNSITSKKENKVDNSQMQANVKAIVDVIKEKILGKQAAANLANSLAPPQTQTQSITQQMSAQQQQVIHSPMAPILSPVTPVTPTTVGNTPSFNYDFHHNNNNEVQFTREDQEMLYANEINLLREQLQFRMPSQPSNQNRFQIHEKQHSRRHSDSSDLIVNCNDNNSSKVSTNASYTSSSDCYSTQQFNDLLRRRTQRTCSDPGSEPIMTINTNYHSPQPQMYNQCYHQSHSVPTTPTSLYHSNSTLQPQSYPHSMPSTPTAPIAPISFIHSPQHSQRESLPSTPTDGQQFNFIPVASPVNKSSVQSQYSTSPASVAQYSPNTPYSPSHASVPQFTYTVQPPSQTNNNVYEQRIQYNNEESTMYAAISNYTNAGSDGNNTTISEDHFSFDNNLTNNNNYYQTQNHLMTVEANNLQIGTQAIEQISINSLPQPSKPQQFFNNFSSTSHEYPIVTQSSNYVQSSNCWSQSSLANNVEINMKQVLPSLPPNLTPMDSSTIVSNPNVCYSSVTSSTTPFINSSAQSISSSRGTLQMPRSSSSPPNLVVNLEKIDECDEETDDVFLSPVGVAPSPKRTSPSIPTGVVSPKRTKHRPEPLYIPPHVNTCGYQSRLRSPRLWDPASVADIKNLSPPPYTPPPMLSPVRSGPGLFWHIISGSMTPKSGTITPKFVYARKSSSDREREDTTNLIVTNTPTTAYEPFDCEIPETDIQPHVNIGPSFQARIPAFNQNRDEAKYRTDKADLVWDPTITESLTEEDIESFLELSCCACVPGSGRNKEYALHLLNLSKGDIHDAIVKLLEPHPVIDERHPLADYQYPENDIWVPQEIESYQSALTKCDKDFFTIAKEIGTKSVKQCIQFYYMWKKVCPDEYRRLRAIRRKREHETIFYNLRSKEGEESNNNNNSGQEIKFENDYEMDNNNGTDMNGLVNSGQSSDFDDNVSSLMDSANPSPATSVGSIAPPVDYPCKLCGKVFQKVKSRSAHMKIHGSGSAKY